MFCNGFQVSFQVFLRVFQMHVSSVSFAFRCMFQMLHLRCFKSRSGVLHMLQPAAAAGGHEGSYGA
jgi:hypothetical protein